MNIHNNLINHGLKSLLLAADHLSQVADLFVTSLRGRPQLLIAVESRWQSEEICTVTTFCAHPLEVLLLPLSNTTIDL